MRACRRVRRSLRTDAYATLVRAIHDDSVTDELDEFVHGRSVVGIMGGHALQRDSAAYARHQRLGRGWARRILAEAGRDEAALADALGRPGRTLAKMLDEYCYLAITRGWRSEPESGRRGATAAEPAAR